MAKMPSLNINDLCRLCLVKEKVSVPIFEGEGDNRQIFVKIAACLPVKVEKNDKLPKKICDSCLHKVENVYQFWNTTANSEKQLLRWLEETKADDYPKDKSTIENTSAIETEQLMLKEEAADDDDDEEDQPADKLGDGSLDLGDSDGDGNDFSEEDSNSDEIMSEVGDDIPEDDKAAGNSADEDEDEELEPTTFVNVSMGCEDQAGPSGAQEAMEEEEEDPVAVDLPAAPAPQKAAPQTGQVLPVATVAMQPALATAAASTSKAVALPSGSSIGKVTLWESSSSVAFSHTKGRDARDPLQRYICEYCSQLFASLHSLTIHRHHDHEPGKAIQCLYCEAVFQSCKSWHSHLQSHIEQRRTPCNVCSNMCKKLCKLNEEKAHDAEQIHVCGQCDMGCYRDYQLENAHNQVGKIRFACRYCGKSYTQKSYVMIHCRAQHPEFLKKHIPFKCGECGKCFAYRRSLKLHVATHEVGGQRVQFLCDVCGKAVMSKESLRQHRRTHTGEKPFVCSVCRKAFSRQNYLRVHLRTHTGEKPYACKLCDKTFSQRSPLIIHERYHSGEKPYKCSICHKAYVSKNLLKAHLKSHNVEMP